MCVFCLCALRRQMRQRRKTRNKAHRERDSTDCEVKIVKERREGRRCTVMQINVEKEGYRESGNLHSVCKSYTGCDSRFFQSITPILMSNLISITWIMKMLECYIKLLYQTECKRPCLSYSTWYCLKSVIITEIHWMALAPFYDHFWDISAADYEKKIIVKKTFALWGWWESHFQNIHFLFRKRLPITLLLICILIWQFWKLLLCLEGFSLEHKLQPRPNKPGHYLFCYNNISKLREIH